MANGTRTRPRMDRIYILIGGLALVVAADGVAAGDATSDKAPPDTRPELTVGCRFAGPEGRQGLGAGSAALRQQPTSHEPALKQKSSQATAETARLQLELLASRLHEQLSAEVAARRASEARLAKLTRRHDAVTRKLAVTEDRLDDEVAKRRKLERSARSRRRLSNRSNWKPPAGAMGKSAGETDGGPPPSEEKPNLGTFLLWPWNLPLGVPRDCLGGCR